MNDLFNLRVRRSLQEGIESFLSAEVYDEVKGHNAWKFNQLLLKEQRGLIKFVEQNGKLAVVNTVVAQDSADSSSDSLQFKGGV